MTRTHRPAARQARRAALAVGLALLLVVPSSSPALSADDPEVVVRPTTAGDSAVRAGQSVTVSGQVPDGEIASARLLGLRADGSEVAFEPVDRFVLNQPEPAPTTGGDYLDVDGGELSGRLTLGCLFSTPDPRKACTARDGRTDEVRLLRLEVTVGPAASSTSALSGPLRVDDTRPEFRDAELVGPRQLLVRFTEPVRYPTTQPEAGGDWRVLVDGQQVPVVGVGPARTDDCVGRYGPGEDASAGPTGCTRTLTLLTEVDEDAQPEVEYVLFDNRVPDRTAYLDAASNRAFQANVGLKTAADRIRPPAPRVERLAGRVPSQGRVDAADAAPVLELSGLRAGHAAYARITSPAGETVTTEPVQASGDAVSLPLPDLGDDGEHVVEAVAADPAGNTSDEQALTAARPDGDPRAVRYGLDTVAPVVLGALTDDGALAVSFTEPVAGVDDPDAWTLTSGVQVTGVTGTGAQRSLEVDGPVQPLDELVYAPEGGRYADAAGNGVADTTVLVSGVRAPRVEVPSVVTYTDVAQAAVSGSTDAGTQVLLYADADRNGRPDSTEPVGRGAADGERWTVDVPLDRNARNDLLAQATTAEDASPFVAVPAIVHDDVAPSVEALRPAEGVVLAGGASTPVEWRTSDANRGAGATMRVEIALGGGDYTVLEPAAPAASGSTAVVLPTPPANITAQVRLTTADLAGNVGRGLSAVFTIDPTAPVFAARTTALRTVEVLFSEPVSGPLGLDWRVAGQPAAVASADGERAVRADGARVLVLTTSADFDPDARPDVTYAPAAPEVTGQLVDAAGQPVPVGARSTQADDAIRPAAPQITAVAGRAPAGGSVLGVEPRPVVAVDGVRAGNRVLVERADESGAVEGTAVTAGGSTAEVTSPLVPADGPHLLRVVAVDPAGNRSTQTALNAPSADRSPNPVTYVLDTVAPVVLTADPDGDDLVVTLSEAVTGPDAAAHWTVTAPDGTVRPVTGVTGSGSTRTLAVQGGAPAAGTARYAPPGDRYRDAAGNPVDDRTVVIGGVPVPVVLTPSTPALTSQRVVEIAGTGRPGVLVELRREGADAVVDTATVASDGSWAVAAPLVVDSENRFVVTAVDPASGDRSVAAPVPPVVQDARRPALTVLEPTGGELLAGGSEGTVRWSTSDANQAPDGMRVELTLDGVTWSVLAAAAAPGGDEGAVEYSVPRQSTDRAQVRVAATDLAGNSAVVTSPAFTIDALAPAFGARTVRADEVLVRFSEPVNGPLAPGDFLVDGVPALVTSADGDSAGTVRAAAVQELRLRTAVPVGPNDTPLVRYAPTAVGEVTDEAGNPVAVRTVTALDGIVPAAPQVTEPGGTVYEDDVRRRYAGTSEVGTVVRLLAADGSPASGTVRTAADGAWSATGELRRDTTVVLRAIAVDDAGNTSTATQAPSVVQDSTAPRVVVRAPQPGSQLPLDSDVPVQWAASDANLTPRSVVVDVTTDGGRTWTQLADEQPAEGTVTWRTPAEPTSQAAVRVRALDLAGRTGGVAEPYGVGVPAQTSGPAPTTATQPLPAAGAVTDTELSVRERVSGALPQTGTDLLRLAMLSLVVLLTGAGCLVAARDARRSRRRRSA